MTPIGMGLGLLAALIYGTADLAGGIASRRSPALTVVLGSYVIALPLLAVGAIVEGGAAFSTAQLAWSVAGGVAEVIAILALYLALASGTMSLISPCVGIVGAGIPVLVGLTLGESMAAPQAVGMALAFLAMIVVARPRVDGPMSRRSLGYAFTAGCAFAVSFIAFSGAQSEPGGAGAWGMALVARIVGLVLALGAVLLTRRPLVAARGDLPWVAVAGLFDGLAMACLLAAYGAGPLGLTTVVASLYPAVTVVLAAILLRERLGRLESAGVVVAILAVVLMGAASG
jgi:uncharacterized membrane protein